MGQPKNQRRNQKVHGNKQNENTKVWNLWDAGKAALRGKFITIPQEARKTAKKKKTPQPNLTPKGARKIKTKPKTNRRKKIIKIRAQINNLTTNKTIEEINETRSWFFEKINKIDKPLKDSERERPQVKKITNERKEIITNIAEIQIIVRENYEKLYANKLDNLKEMDKFLEMYNQNWSRKK